MLAEIQAWAESQTDGPDFVFKVFRKFLEYYCAEMLPENFVTNDWARNMLRELCFASQFFTLPP